MNTYDYIIIGAGPAGLQMGYFLEKAKRNYLIIEAKDGVGSFFRAQPRHRTMISLNKRFNYYPEADFNMRHDWNSLLTDDYSHLFRDYSEELYPNAEDFLRYLQDFADKYALKIQYNTKITLVDREKNGDKQFVLTDANDNIYKCSCLLLATGAVAPYIPYEIEGIELAEGYENHDIDPKPYENQRVLLIGRGNSAFEVANHLAGHAAIVHIAIGNRPVDLAWDTHFVGNVRSINNTIIEMAHVKALHGVVGFAVERIRQQADGTFAVDVAYDVPHWEQPGISHNTLTYERVIRCTGWRYVEPTFFADDLRPEVDAKTKYPVLSSTWESTIPDLFFIGTASAGRDRKAASGFIHGFRYSIRTLFRLLEERYTAIPLPSTHYSLQTTQDLTQVAEKIVERASLSSALYQLFGVLGDVWVFTAGAVEHYAELPMAHILERPDFSKGKEILVVTMEYGFEHFPPVSSLNFIALPKDRHCSAFLHPVFYHYVDGQLVEKDNLGESLVIRYGDFSGVFGKRINFHKNIVMNVVNRIAKITSEIYPEKMEHPRNFETWPEGKPVLFRQPECLLDQSTAKEVLTNQ